MGAHCETKTDPGLQITHLDFITAPPGGIQLNTENAHYELQVTYNNPLKTPVDSMAAMGIFFEDSDFMRPFWSLPDHAGASCMVNSPDSKCRLQNAAKKGHDYPMWQTDYAPTLPDPRVVELTTNAGPMDFYIDPSIAPHSATYMYNLFTHGAIDGTKIWFYGKDWVLSVAAPADKAPAFKDKIEPAKKWLRCLPLEPSAPKAHTLYALSLAHDGETPDNGFGGFSIVLDKAPHMDKHYCVFGRLIPNAQTIKTLHTIENNFGPEKYWVISGKQI